MEIALILAGVLMISRIYAEYLRRGGNELREFCDFLGKLNLRVAAYLDVGADFIKYEDFPSLKRVGFIDAIVGGASFFEGYCACMPRLGITKSDKKLLYDFFSEYGRSDMQTEIRRTEQIISALHIKCEGTRTEIEKKIKVFTSVSLALCLGVAILII